MHIVVIEMDAPGLAFKVTPPGGTRETVRQTTLEFVNQEHAQLGINGHFFLPFPSDDSDANVIGLAASEGLVYSPFEPQPIGPGYCDQSYAILPYAPALNIDHFNRACIVHWDPNYPDNRHVQELVTLWNSLSGSAQIISNGVKTIPDYSGSPGGLSPLDGYSDEYSWYYSELRARTCIGLSSNNEKLVLFVVDEVGLSDGMTVDQAADILIQDYDVYNALNLDGGGSTTMVLEDPRTYVGAIVNSPSEGCLGRATGSNLAVFAQPNSEPAMLLLLQLTAGGCFIISWPAFSEGWQLQQNSGLAQNDWSDVLTPPTRIGDRFILNVGPGTGSRFYRLKKSL
jgi:hypothetical protein